MFLNGFVNQNGNIYFWDDQKKCAQPRSPRSIAREPHLYTVISANGKDYTVEKKLGDIENAAKPLFEKIVNTGFDALSEEDIKFLIDFIVITINRTPLATGVSEYAIREGRTQTEMRAINEGHAEKIIQRCLHSKGLAFAMTFESHFLYRHKAITDNFDIYLLTAENGSPEFLLNDRFLCLELITPYKSKIIDWAKINTKMHFPVSNRHCVSFIPKADSARKGTSQITINKGIISARDIMIINQLAFASKDRYAYCANNSVLEILHKLQ